MKEWEAYEAALKAFDEKHEPKRRALVALGKALEVGWEWVKLGDPSEPVSVQRYARPDFEPVDPTSLAELSGASTVQAILEERATLTERIWTARQALPPSLQERLAVADAAPGRRPRPK